MATAASGDRMHSGAPPNSSVAAAAAAAAAAAMAAAAVGDDATHHHADAGARAGAGAVDDEGAPDAAGQSLVENIIRAVEQSSAVPAADTGASSGGANGQSEHALAALVEAAGRDAGHRPAVEHGYRSWGGQPSATLLGKRKAGPHALTQAEKHELVRTTVQRHLKTLSNLYGSENPTGSGSGGERERPVMTTVRCMHGAVAQKSYGSEKRFLCPPPVVKISGSLRYHDGHIMSLSLPNKDPSIESVGLPSLSMNVIAEDGQDTYSEQHAALDPAMHSRFRFLHVAGTGKSKNFRLQLNLLRPRHRKEGQPLAKHRKGNLDAAELAAAVRREAAGTASAAELADSFGDVDGAGIMGGASGPSVKTWNFNLDQVSHLVTMEYWASFESAPVGIISKPSRKSAKVRNTSSNIVSGSLVALYSRINSQTVRTKYMAVGSNQQHLVSLHNGWSAFRIQLIARPPEAEFAAQDEDIITYGSVVVLTDTATGCSTDPLVLCKVDRGKIYIPRTDEDESYYDALGGAADAGQNGQNGHGPEAGPSRAGHTNGGADSAATIQEIAQRAAAMAESSAAEMEQNGGIGDGRRDEDGHRQPTHDEIFAEAHAEALTAAGLQPHAYQGATAAVPARSTSAPVKPAIKRSIAEEHNIFGAISQMQKVAFLRFEPRSGVSDPDSEMYDPEQASLDPNFDGERYYLTAMDYDRFVKDDGSGTVHAKGSEQEATVYPPSDDYYVGENGINPALTLEPPSSEGDPPLVYAPPPPILAGQMTTRKRNEDDIDDSYGWTIIGISQFEFSFFEAYGQPSAEDDNTLPITPFPIITSMPLYDAQSHTLTTTALNFYYYPENEGDDATGGGGGNGAATAQPALVSMEVWLGPLGPLSCRSKPRSDRTGGESEIAVELPPMEAILECTREQRETARRNAAASVAASAATAAAAAAAAAVSSSLEGGAAGSGAVGSAGGAGADGEEAAAEGTGAGEEAASTSNDEAAGHVPQYLPLLFVRGSDGTGYHSGRHIAIEDIVSLMQSAAHDPSANDTLHNISFHQPPGGPENETWTLRVV